MEAGLWVCCERPRSGRFGERVKSLYLLVSVLLEPWDRWLWIPVENLGSGPEAQGPLLWRLCSEEPFSFLPLAAWSLGAPLAGGADPAVSLMEDPPQRLRWQAHLEFTHNHDVGDLTWDKIAMSLPRSDKLRSLVLAGIPHSMRPQVSPGGGTCRGRPRAQVPPEAEHLWAPALSCGCGCLGPCRRREAPSCPTGR